MQFVWDRVKAESNALKHGITFQEAATVFDDQNAKALPDQKHSTANEQRSHLIGYSRENRILLVVHIARDEVFHNGKTDQAVRIISARKASRHERELYGEPSA